MRAGRLFHVGLKVSKHECVNPPGDLPKVIQASISLRSRMSVRTHLFGDTVGVHAQLEGYLSV